MEMRQSGTSSMRSGRSIGRVGDVVPGERQLRDTVHANHVGVLIVADYRLYVARSIDSYARISVERIDRVSQERAGLDGTVFAVEEIDGARCDCCPAYEHLRMLALDVGYFLRALIRTQSAWIARRTWPTTPPMGISHGLEHPQTPGFVDTPLFAAQLSLP